ncbi:D-aminoacyl-tRNA deacylase 2-like [Actinia tenebrosa]|uniref:D-aminoacyl-tRNA deacylase n=1 Tax=Actinia tenebrosa TaxID=6105 RepID=A0A6P8HEH9_ACTTE|nr:D-aminoacyl-tRNA deacylase 2-like [Actinia tenebrosa]
MASSTSGPCVRVIMQQCLSARLQVQPPSDQKPAEYVEIKRGVILHVAFLKGAALDIIPKVVKAVLNVRLSETDSNSKVSVLELPGDVLIVPQATIGGKLKGKSMQYHTNIAKTEALELYKEFVSLCNKTVSEEAKKADSDVSPQVKWGTYGNRQVLSSCTNGPYTHVLDF